jgi:hypothetical protein
MSLIFFPLYWVARITEVLNLKGLRARMNRKDKARHTPRRPATDKILFFSASFIQKRKRLKHQKHSDLVTTFLFLPSCIFTASVLD